MNNATTAILVAEKIYGSHAYAQSVFWSLDQILREMVLLVVIDKNMTLADAIMFVQWKVIQ